MKFVTENQLTLGEVTVEEKSNEITAVPELLELVDVKDNIVTADTMSCQKEIVRKIHEKKANYVIALKGNQPTLLEDAPAYFQTFTPELPMTHNLEKDHGRIEKRSYYLATDLSWLPERKEWLGLKSIGVVKTKRVCQEQETTEVRYYLTSLTNVERVVYAARKHWSIENQLHWCLDVIFDEDGSRARKDLPPLNLNVLRKTALALCRNIDLGKRVSLQKKRYRAALSPETFLQILFGKS